MRPATTDCRSPAIWSAPERAFGDRDLHVAGLLQHCLAVVDHKAGCAVTVAVSISRVCGWYDPIALTWVPGRSSSPSNSGSAAVVQQHTMSASATSSGVPARASSPAARSSARSASTRLGLRPTTVIARDRTHRPHRLDVRARLHTGPEHHEPGGIRRAARYRVARPETARGADGRQLASVDHRRPVRACRGENSTYMPCTSGRPRAGLSGWSVTSFTPGRAAGARLRASARSSPATCGDRRAQWYGQLAGALRNAVSRHRSRRSHGQPRAQPAASIYIVTRRSARGAPSAVEPGRRERRDVHERLPPEVQVAHDLADRRALQKAVAGEPRRIQKPCRGRRPPRRSRCGRARPRTAPPIRRRCRPRRSPVPAARRPRAAPGIQSSVASSLNPGVSLGSAMPISRP